jgi:hypothetical protein
MNFWDRQVFPSLCGLSVCLSVCLSLSRVLFPFARLDICVNWLGTGGSIRYDLCCTVPTSTHTPSLSRILYIFLSCLAHVQVAGVGLVTSAAAGEEKGSGGNGQRAQRGLTGSLPHPLAAITNHRSSFFSGHPAVMVMVWEDGILPGQVVPLL